MTTKPTTIQSILRRSLALLILLFLAQPLLAYYCPATGRFLSRDPIGEHGGTNLYAFTRNRPIDHIDLLGAADASHQCDPNLQVTDDAGATCCECKLTTVEIRVRKPAKSCREQIREMKEAGKSLREIIASVDTGHTWIWFLPENIGWGFTAASLSYRDIRGHTPGRVANENRNQPYTHNKSFNTCPSTKKKIRDSIRSQKNHPTRYDYRDKKMDNGRAQCTTWSCEILTDAGIDMPIPKGDADPFALAECEGFLENKAKKEK